MAAKKKASTKRAARKPLSGAKKKSTKTKVDDSAALRVELARLFRRSKGASEILADLSPTERAWYRALPAELKTIVEYVVDEVALPHPKARTLYGLGDLLEWNGDEGTFGQLREVVDDSPYDRVVKIGADLFLDVKGQVKAPGSVHVAIAHELDGAECIAEDLLELLQSARQTDVVDEPPRPTLNSKPQPVPVSEWEPTTQRRLEAAGSACVVSVPRSFVMEQHNDGFIARCPTKAASVGVFGLPNLADASDELRSAGLFDLVRSETDAQGGLVETQTSTTRLMRLGNGFVRCYVTGGTAEQRLVVCRSLALAP
jgi:hypothetical protein